MIEWMTADDPLAVEYRDDRPVLRLMAGVALIAAADAALLHWWGSAFGLRPALYFLFALNHGRRVPGELLAGGLALLALGALAQWLAGAGVARLVFGVGVGSLILVAGFAVARIGDVVVRRVVGMALVAIAILARLDLVEPATPPSDPSVAVLTSVPIGVGAAKDGARLTQELRKRSPTTLLDSVPATGPAADRLLLLQPPALPGEAMVALDDWVRRGGQAVVLDDPRLNWRAGRPLGDPAGPLSVSLLDPLLARWGLRLEELVGAEAGPATLDLPHGILTLPSPGRFTRLSGECALLHQAKVARCRVGRGRVLFVADADWVDPANWSADGRGVLTHALATGELDVVPLDRRALWLAVALLIAGLLALIVERVGNRRGTGEKQTG